VGTKLLPHEIHASGLGSLPPSLTVNSLNQVIGLIFVIAQAGGAIFPALTGVIATRAGVGVLQPILIGLIVAMGLSWALIPKVIKKPSD
jgi:fucose permease